jgi:hypothetical protein
LAAHRIPQVTVPLCLTTESTDLCLAILGVLCVLGVNAGPQFNRQVAKDAKKRQAKKFGCGYAEYEDKLRLCA